MKTKLTIRELAPYLPYGLKIKTDFTEGTTIWTGIYELTINSYSNIIKGNSKPILYPLSWLTKEIEHNGEKFYVGDKFKESCFPTQFSNRKWFRNKINRDNILDILPYSMIKLLFEYHFNVFNLPEHLYIDKSTLKDKEGDTINKQLNK